MQSKNIDEISVQDITETATVNRATFYDHYTDKYALLDALIASGFHMMLHERNVSFDGTCPSAARAIILATCDYITQIHANPVECNRQNAFEPLIEAAITTAIRYVIIKGMPKESAPTNLSPEIIATATSWAIYGAVKQWFYTPDHVPPEEIVPPILQLIIPLLMAAGPLEQHHAESLAS
jgi:AcrR family transcriptional regulator